jgi:hypothetical protein
MKKCEKRVLTITGLMMLSIFLLLPLNSWAGNSPPPGGTTVAVGPSIKGTAYATQCSDNNVHVTFQGKCNGKYITWEQYFPTNLDAITEELLPTWEFELNYTALGNCLPKPKLTPYALIVDKVKSFEHSSPGLIIADVTLLFLAY